jgi:hypothetical protein
VGQIESRNDAEALRSQLLRPFEKTDRIVEGVMDPMNERGLRIDVEGGMVKRQIMAVVRPEHQTVTREADRTAVGVFPWSGRC